MDKNVEIAYSSFIDCIQKLQQNGESQAIDELLATATNDLKILRNSCAAGPQVQQSILDLPKTAEIFNFVLFHSESNKYRTFSAYVFLEKMCWQFMANICVQNPLTQTRIWQMFGEQLLTSVEQLSPHKNIQLMILYNIFRGCDLTSWDKRIFQALVAILSENLQSGEGYEFLHIFLEFFVTGYHRITLLYNTIPDESRTIFLYYLADSLRDNPNYGPINNAFLTYISKEFKKKSDCILSANQRIMHAKEVVALMELIALASGNEIYRQVYIADHSLFLNVGAVLQQLNAIGDAANNIFTPMKKLEQVTPNSNIDSNFEKEISFQLKTTLVRILANLSFKNRKNQEYAREMGIILAILDCTNVDGRNPLIKEWSILAVRNLCENCPENQEIIANLTKVGDVQNDVLKELNIDLGSLRIQGNQG